MRQAEKVSLGSEEGCSECGPNRNKQMAAAKLAVLAAAAMASAEKGAHTAEEAKSDMDAGNAQVCVSLVLSVKMKLWIERVFEVDAVCAVGSKVGSAE